jgi:hypothetical protein
MPDTHETSKKSATSATEEQKRKPKAVLRAPPVKDKIDHAGLTRRIIARFPKILAALAK